MKILQIPDDDVPEPERASSPSPISAPAPAPASHPDPAPDLGRVDALEDITKLILSKLHAIEERIQALESSPAAAGGGPTLPYRPPTKTLGGDDAVRTSVVVNTDAMNKDLFSKMWKYLNDKAA